MNAFSDAMKGIRDIMILDARVEHLDKTVARAGEDIKGLTQSMTLLDRRVSRLEGFIEGVSTASNQPPPRIENREDE